MGHETDHSTEGGIRMKELEFAMMYPAIFAAVKLNIDAERCP